MLGLIPSVEGLPRTKDQPPLSKKEFCTNGLQTWTGSSLGLQPAISPPDFGLVSLHNPVNQFCVYLYLSVCVCVLVAQLRLTLCDPIDCSLPGLSVHGILQAGILERRAIPFSRGSSQPKNQAQVSYIAGRFFTVWAMSKVPICTHTHTPCLFWRNLTNIDGLAGSLKKIRHFLNTYSQAKQFELHLVFTASH